MTTNELISDLFNRKSVKGERIGDWEMIINFLLVPFYPLFILINRRYKMRKMKLKRR